MITVILFIAVSELYTGPHQGVVDGQENPYETIFLTKFYEVQKYEIIYSLCHDESISKFIRFSSKPLATDGDGFDEFIPTFT